MMPKIVCEFVRAHGMEDWEVFPHDGHWFARHNNSDKVYFLI